MQYRTQKGHCVVRYFDANNDTILNDPHLHNLETGTTAGIGSIMLQQFRTVTCLLQAFMRCFCKANTAPLILKRPTSSTFL